MADAPPARPSAREAVEQYAVLIPCRDEAHQVELLRRFQAEGIACKSLVS